MHTDQMTAGITIILRLLYLAVLTLTTIGKPMDNAHPLTDRVCEVLGASCMEGRDGGEGSAHAEEGMGPCWVDLGDRGHEAGEDEGPSILCPLDGDRDGRRKDQEAAYEWKNGLHYLAVWNFDLAISLSLHPFLPPYVSCRDRPSLSDLPSPARQGSGSLT